MNKEEILKEIKKCKTPEEIVKLGKEYNKDITIEKAQEVFNEFHCDSTISDEELGNVSGGRGDYCTNYEFYDDGRRAFEKNVTFVVEIDQKVHFKPNDSAYVYGGTVKSRRAGYYTKGCDKGYRDFYTIIEDGVLKQHEVTRNRIAKN